MKISILGYSGAGKSTLASLLSKKYNITTLHFDTIQFLPDWEIRCDEEKLRLIQEFLDTHDEWVIDGNYSRFCFDRRMEESDKIILLLFNRFSCLYRCFKRYIKYKDETRPDMAVGCKEKLDSEFIKWILFSGRTKKKKEKFRQLISQYKDKVVVIKNQKQLDKYVDFITKT